MSTKAQDTEQKIKEAARIIFQQKGFAGTKTRDIAEAADINLALLNYYFRSKKKLFDIIMTETMQSFFSGLLVVLNNDQTNLKEKLSAIIEYYIDLLSENPNIATFVINTVRENPTEFIAKMGLLDKIKSSNFIQQFQQAMMSGKIPPINPIHLMINIMGLVVFPFIVQPIITTATGLPDDTFHDLMQERKRLIPLWIDTMLTVQ